MQLYVKRVFIMDDCDALMPEYLRFVKGVVDAQDLSLNVSREILQQDRQIQLIRRRLVKKVLSTIKDMQSDAPRRTTRRSGGSSAGSLKEGLLSDSTTATRSWRSPRSPRPTTRTRRPRCAEYVERMKEGQEQIYYVTGESRPSIENSPHLEAFRAKGFEVLLLTDPVDEVWVESVPEFDGKPLQSVAKGEVDLGHRRGEERPTEAQGSGLRRSADVDDGAARRTNVKEVRLSTRLTTSPACIVGDTHDITPTLENMYRAMGQEVPQIKRILELNPTHPLVERAATAHVRGRANASRLAETAELLYGLALLAEGGELADPSRFVKLMADRLQRTF